MEKGDKRKLLQPLTVRTSYSVGTISEGEIIEIQQVDVKGSQVLVHDVWMYAPTIKRMSEPYKEPSL